MSTFGRTKQSRKRRALGQHYIIDKSVIDLIIRTATIRRDQRVLEIGTGRGELTNELCKISTSVEGFELDRDNYLATQRLGLKGLTLHLNNAFENTIDFDVLVSSLPYSESSSFIEWLAKLRYEKAVVILQKDFAEKLLAQPNHSNYRAISVIAQISSTIRIIRFIDRKSFRPSPLVSSALVEMEFRRKISPEQIYLVKMLFSQRRRKFQVALKNLDLGSTLPAGPEQLSRRVEQFTVSEFEELIGKKSEGKEEDDKTPYNAERRERIDSFK